MPKQIPAVQDVTKKQLDEIIRWAEKLGAHYAYNASRGGYQINGTVYRVPPFSFQDEQRARPNIGWRDGNYFYCLSHSSVNVPSAQFFNEGEDGYWSGRRCDWCGLLIKKATR
jgi:hypothetical protein